MSLTYDFLLSDDPGKLQIGHCKFQNDEIIIPTQQPTKNRPRMIRKSRLVKVTFGCCAVIFLILQFLDHSTEPKDAPVAASNLEFVTQQPLASSEVNTHQVKPVNLNLSSPSPPLVPSKSSSSSSASAASEAASSVVVKKAENEVSEEIVKEPRSSLSGERIHGLPNETALPLSSQNSQHNLPSSGQILTEIPKILAQIKRINEEQSIKNEDIFGPVTNATVVIAIQVHNRLQYLRQLIISLSQVLKRVCETSFVHFQTL